MTTNQDIIMYQPTVWWEGWPVRLQTSLGATFFSESVTGYGPISTNRGVLCTSSHILQPRLQTNKKRD